MSDLELVEMLSARELWPPDLSADQVSVLTRRGLYLLAVAGIGEPPSKAPHVSELEPLVPYHHRKLDSFFVSAMLCYGGRDPFADSLAPHVLAASLLELKGGSLEVAKKACRSIRLMPQDHHQEVLAALEDFSGMETRDVLDRLRRIRDSIPDGGLPRKASLAMQSRLDPLVNLLARYVDGKTRPPTVKADLRRRTSAVAAVAETDIAKGELHHFHRGSDGAQDDGGLDSACGFADFAPSGTPAHRRSEAIQNYRARAAAAQIVRGYMMSPCRWGVLSPQQLQRIVRQLRGGVLEKQEIDALLIASLLTGRRAKDLSEMRRLEVPAEESGSGTKVRYRDDELLVYRGKQIALRTGLRLPAPGGEHPNYYREAKPPLYLPLPSEVLDCLKYSRPKQGCDDEKLAERTRELGTTLPRIESTGRLWLYHNGHDRTVLSRLFGDDLAHATPIYYENMSYERVLRTYQAWYDHINKQIPWAMFKIRRTKRKSHVGSRRTPKANVVKNLFREYRDFVSGLLEKPEDLIRAHEHYAVYTHLVLSLASGLRPVRQPFETIKHFCAETGTYFIQDKDVGGIPSPRYVTLAPFAVKQLEHYLAYLSWLPIRLSAYSRDREYVAAALQGQVPYLFSLDQGPLNPMPLTPSLIQKTLGDISHLVPNWFRHFLRTALTERCVRDEVIRALLGHGDMGQEGFARYSGLTMADLKDAADQIEALAGDLGIEPLAHPKAPPTWTRQETPTRKTFEYMDRSKARHRESAARRKRETQLGLEWVNERIRVIQDDMDGLRNPEAADEWQKRALADLDERFKGKFAWLAARRAWAKAADGLNEKHNLDIPVASAPRRPWRTPLMHDHAAFLARSAVQTAAAKLVETMRDPQPLLEAPDDSLLSLAAFSAACFGGLAEPAALLAFVQKAWMWDQRTPFLKLAPAPLHLCWVACQHESRGAANVVADGKPLRLRRFFLDGMTLVLLVRYLAQQRTKRRAVNRRTYGGEELMQRIRTALKKHCGANLPRGFSLAKLCRGAVGVAESQSGVRLPHYLAEYAAGLITSLSLPENYLRVYLGRTYPPAIELPERKAARRRPSTPPPDSQPDPKIDGALRQVRGLFVALPEEHAKARRTVIERMDDLLSSGQSLPTQRLVEWLKDLISRPNRPLAVSSVRRYSDWIATGWLTQFEGVDLERLTGEEWCRRYRDLLELEEEHDRSNVAGRISHFHQHMSGTHGYERLPDEQLISYRSQRFVRAQAIPERLFAAFVERLSGELPNAGQRECVRWIFTLCYRLGTRIGETTRIRMSDIEEGEDPVVRLRANRFGTTKTKTPHQLPLNPFLPDAERQGFRTWLEQRRAIAREDNALLFGKDGSPNLLWDKRELARLFTKSMYELSGTHFSPHALRHSAASRLIWIAESETAPEGSAYTDEEVEALKRAVFTAASDCRDRVWHLSSVFNHHSPSTTLESYVHFLDLLLHRKLSQSQRRIPTQALARLLDAPQKRFSASGRRNREGFPIEEILPIAFESNKALFDVLKPAAAAVPTAPKAPPIRAKAQRPMLYRKAQPMLEDLENGLEEETVAIRFGVEVDSVKALAWSASRLAELTTSRGVSRLFGKKRLKRVPNPLSPTRVRGIPDQRLFAALMPQLEGERRTRRRNRIREACRHFLTHVTTTHSKLPFHTPEALERFLRVFFDLQPEPIDRKRWLVLVNRVQTRSKEEQLAAWRVDEGISVKCGPLDATESARSPHGVAHLHLQIEGEGKRRGARKETSKIMKPVLHLLSTLLLAEDFLERGEEAERDWLLRQPD